jgi:hypothetical protein
MVLMGAGGAHAAAQHNDGGAHQRQQVHKEIYRTCHEAESFEAWQAQLLATPSADGKGESCEL